MMVGARVGQKPSAAQQEAASNGRARRAIYTLAARGQLAKKDESGATVLDRLETLQGQALGEGINRAELFASSGQAINFGSGTPGSDRVANTLTRQLASKNPADFLRQVSELASPQARTEIRPGVEIRAKSVGSNAAAIFQAAVAPVAKRELMHLELRDQPERLKAYQALNPEQRRAFHSVLASQMPDGTSPEFPKSGSREAFDAYSQQRTEHFSEEKIGTQTRSQLYSMLEAGKITAESIPGLEGQLRKHQRESDYIVPQPDHHGVFAAEQERNANLPSNAARSRLLGQAMASGKPTVVRNSEGRLVSVAITRVGAGYRLKLGDSAPVGVELKGNFTVQQRADALERLTDYYSQVPKHLRGHATSYEIHEKSAADTPGKGGSAAADYTDSERRIRFFNGLKHVDEHTFNHEYGHAVGFAVERQQDNILERVFSRFDRGEAGAPEGWKSAMEQDSQTVSSYSNRNRIEDFAESFTSYMEAREYGKDVVQSSLASRYPARTKILQEVFRAPA